MSAVVTARFAITHTPEGQHDPDQTDPPQPNASPEASSTTDLGGPRRSLARVPAAGARLLAPLRVHYRRVGRVPTGKGRVERPGRIVHDHVIAGRRFDSVADL